MTVLSHLKDVASCAVLSSREASSINASVSSLQAKITSHFGAAVCEHFKFGSCTRETILPRKIDENSDVDYMVVFKAEAAKPQAYLDRLKRFVEATYTRSEIKQSHPTIVLELAHIKFDLVPAIAFYGGYNIPAPASGWSEWSPTYPNSFNATLTEKNKQHNYNIKPLVRLVKYWNALGGYIFESYGLEQHIVSYARPQSTLSEYLYYAFDSLAIGPHVAQSRKDKLERARQIVSITRQHEREGRALEAEKEIKKLIPAVA